MDPLSQREEEKLEAYLDHKLQNQEREQLEKKVQDLPDLDGYLEFLKFIKRAGKRMQIAPAPLDLVDKVMTTIFIPQRVPIFRKWAPVLTLASACLAIGFFFGKQIKTGQEIIPVRFELLAPRAQSVSIAGDFTDWMPVALTKKENRWQTVLKIPQGKYQYIYILNRRVFVVDPDAEVEKDHKGEFYSVLDTTKGRKI